MAITRNGISPLLSYVFLIAVILAGIFIVVQGTEPILSSSKDVNAIETAKQTVTDVDSRIRSASSAGKFSRQTFSLHVRRGTYSLNSSADAFLYQIETDTDAVSPGTTERFGNLWIIADEGNVTTVTVKANYTDIDLRGLNQSLTNGIHNLAIENTGAKGGKAVVEVDLE
jgi:hypothetical protein